MLSCESQGPADIVSSQDMEGAVFAKQGFNFTAHLSGDNEVPARDTDAAGQAIFNLSKDGTVLHYKLIVSNIKNVLASHIHTAPAGVNGGVVAFLFPGPPVADQDGILAEGDITEENVIGAFAGDFDALIDAMRNGNTYVNVHTTQYPGGEVRGQIK